VVGSTSGTQPGTGSRTLVFTPSPDHDGNVDNYYVEIRLTGGSPLTLVAGAIGKPAVVSGECRTDISGLLNQIPQDYYSTDLVVVLTAVNVFGSSTPATSAPFDW
jgi:hypothetical protein